MTVKERHCVKSGRIRNFSAPCFHGEIFHSSFVFCLFGRKSESFNFETFFIRTNVFGWLNRKMYTNRESLQYTKNQI